MKKVYFLGPAIALAIFTFFYMGFSKEYAEQERLEIEAAAQARIDEQLKEAEDRKKAIEAALALNEERRTERLANESRDLAEKEARQLAIDALDNARRDQRSLAEDVRLLKEVLTGIQADIDEVKEEKDQAAKQITFLNEYVVAANQNVANMQNVVTRIEAANAARQRAQAAAAAAAGSGR